MFSPVIRLAVGRQVRVCFLAAVVAALLISARAFAQAQTGTPPFGSFSGGSFDTVNNANLNVHFSIPIVNKAGVGLPFTYVLNYDSSIWTPVPGGTWKAAGNWGWTGISDGSTGHVAAKQRSQKSHCNSEEEDTIYTFGPYVDPSGTSHNVLVQTTASPCGFPEDNPTGKSPANDGSGLVLNVTNYANASLSLPSGVTIVPQYQGDVTCPPPPTPTVTDPNGNQISSSVGSTTTFTDTLGKTALTITGSGTPASPMVYQYTGPGGANEDVTVRYVSQPVATSFGCSGVKEFPSTSENLPSEVDLPDGTKYIFQYDTSGRMTSLTLPTGGTIRYSYPGSNDGIECSDGSASALNRTTPDSTTAWSYTRPSTGTTVVKDPLGNSTTYTFLNSIYETQRSNSLATVNTCYNSCNGSLTLPITYRQVTTTLGALMSQVNFDYNNLGLTAEVDEYDYGHGAPGPKLRTTTVTYPTTSNDCGITNPNVVNRPCIVSVYDGGGTLRAQTTNTYDANGNLLSAKSATSGSSSLTRSFTYNSNGTVNTATDVNDNVTGYGYGGAGGCNNGLPTSITPSTSLSLSTVLTWDCNGAVPLTVEDEANEALTTLTYDELWRPTTNTDPSTAETKFFYGVNPSMAESELDLISGSSSVEPRVQFDPLGRVSLTQRKQNPSASLFDTQQYTYDALGRPSTVTMPYSGTLGQFDPTNGPVTTTYDTLNRPAEIIDSNGGYTSFSYNANDVLKTVGPAPSGNGEHTKQWQYEYDGLGRLTSVCEITAASGSGNCGQNTAATGFLTKYTYNVLGDLLTVTQNAQSTSTQSRSYQYDELGRLTQESNPESGATNYTYDAYAGCGTTANDVGDLVKRVDANGNVTCYLHDPLHRVTKISYPTIVAPTVATPTKYFVYDNATVNGTAMVNAVGRLAEACTGGSGNCGGTLITDLGFSYTARGETSDLYQSSTDSGGYFHSSATYWANGLIDSLSGPGYPTVNYQPDGEGRVSSISGGGNPVTATSYNVFGEPTAVTFGSGDSDVFQYDANTGRMTQYNYNVGSKTVVGNLTWNANGTLGTLGISDPLNAADTQTCGYTYDDLARIGKVACTNWTQVFSGVPGYASTDYFGNLSKTGSNGGTSFLPVWDPRYTNRIASVGGQTYTYDANGNLLSSGTGTGTSSYSWDADGNLVEETPSGSGSYSRTYDALDRMVEGCCPAEFVYDPLGDKWTRMSGQTAQVGQVPLPGGGRATYSGGTTLAAYDHADWQGSRRLSSSPSRTVLVDIAYAPYGEEYAVTGINFPIFAGLQPDGVLGTYDATFRHYRPDQGRWLSPDPAGLAAVDITNPQSWNRYAYVGNNPTTLIDPKGTRYCPLVDTIDNCGGGNGGGNDFGSTADGFAVPNSLAVGAVIGGLGVQCPNNICFGTNLSGQSVYYAASELGAGYFTYFGPGSLYYSIAAAGLAGALLAQQASADDPVMREYGGDVYAEAGFYSFTPLQYGSPCDPNTGECDFTIQDENPQGTSIIGLYHDHPGTGFGAYSFSEGQPNYDIDVLSAAGYYGFLATQPPGRVLEFNPINYANWLTPGAPPPVCVLQGPAMGIGSCH